MKEKVYLFKFTVEGRGTFPLDMLRYDSCYPHDGNDVAAIESDVREPRKVTLVSVKRHSNGPTVGRWASFGWTVINNA